MANQTVMYTSSKGDLDIDKMDEDHLRNVLKKLVKDGVAPKGEVVVDKVDIVDVNKALKALAVAKNNIAMMGLSATDEGESFWQANIELMTDVEISLSAQLKTITAK